MNTSTSEAQDQADMAELVAGRDEALTALMNRHSERLFHYLIRVLQNETEAADLAQETFARVYINRARFKPGHKFSSWLYTIATNLARDRQRWLARHPQLSLDATADEDTGLKNILPDEAPIPDQKLEHSERAGAVRTAIAALPEDLRIPLILAEYEHQSHAEIGSVLGCSPKAVEMRIYRAKQQLRQSLASLLQSTE